MEACRKNSGLCRKLRKGSFFLVGLVCVVFLQFENLIPVVAMEIGVEKRELQIESTEQKTEQEEIPTESVDEMELTVIKVQQKKYDYEQKKIVISWEPVVYEGESEQEIEKSLYYVISVRNSNGWKMLAQTSDISVDLYVSSYGKNYVYKVEAFISENEVDNFEGVEQPPVCIGQSKEVKVCFPKKISEIITTAISAKKVKLTWKKIDGATSYQVSQVTSTGKVKTLKTVTGITTKLDVTKGKKYTYQIEPMFKEGVVNIVAKAKSVTFDHREFVDIDHQKYTYKEMVADIKALCKKYGEYVSYENIGESEQGRQIYDVILGNEDAEKTILVVSTLHAREYVATITLMKQLEYYLQNYNREIDGVIPAKIFETCSVHYVMMANPDGVTLCQQGKTRLKNNANDVNLNGDFPYKSGKKLSKRQKETQAIVALTKKLNKKNKLYVVNYHAMGQIVFGDYSGKNKKLKNAIADMYTIARDATGYADAGSYGTGSGKGNYREYLIHTLQIPSITIEVGDVWCPVPKHRYASIIKKNKYVILREANYVTSGVIKLVDLKIIVIKKR